MAYTINYGNGITDAGYERIDDAKSAADNGASYTQQPIIITDINGREVCRREWYGVEADDDSIDPIAFGSAGHYAEWSA